jgi:hypothetical protein
MRLGLVASAEALLTHLLSNGERRIEGILPGRRGLGEYVRPAVVGFATTAGVQRGRWGDVEACLTARLQLSIISDSFHDRYTVCETSSGLDR